MKTTMIRNGLWGGLLAASLTGALFSIALAQQNAQTASKPATNQPTSKGEPAMSQHVGYDDTPFLPGNEWRVHDSKRPQPTVVTPSPAGEAVPAPSDAVVLFDGTNLDAWKSGNGEPCKWKIVDGAMEVVRGTGNITSKEEFGDCQLHLEFRAPAEVKGDSQGRANSGVFLMGRYEIQVLDCYQNPTYADGTVGSVYGQTPPLVNASRKPGEWQTYDIIWKGPRFKDIKAETDKIRSQRSTKDSSPVHIDSIVETPATVTVILNGIVVQANTTLIGQTTHRAVGTYAEHPPKGPLVLQDHGDPVRFRSIWYRPL